jgi:DNA-directed RNA polymerase specialized sigma24 family protein
MGVRPPSALAERLSDEWLAHRAAHGDDEAFGDLSRRYAERLARYATGLVGERAAGEHAASVALADVRTALGRGYVPVSVRPWLYRITLNRALASLGERAVAAPAPRPGAADERDRRAVVLRQVRGLSVREIAAQLGLTHQEVERALFAARAPAAHPVPAPAEAPPARRRPPTRAVCAGAALALLAAGGVLGPIAAGGAAEPAGPAGVPSAAVARATADAEVAAASTRTWAAGDAPPAALG